MVVITTEVPIMRHCIHDVFTTTVISGSVCMEKQRRQSTARLAAGQGNELDTVMDFIATQLSLKVVKLKELAAALPSRREAHYLGGGCLWQVRAKASTFVLIE